MAARVSTVYVRSVLRLSVVIEALSNLSSKTTRSEDFSCDMLIISNIFSSFSCNVMYAHYDSVHAMLAYCTLCDVANN